MKKTSVLLLSALALAGALSCTRETVEDVNPLFNPETNEVVTNFVFNVAAAGNAPTRQSEAVVQETGKAFRGISEAKLFSYAVAGADGKIIVAEADADREYDLAQVASPGVLSATNSRRVLEMALPLQTNQLLFYGKATIGTFTAPEENPQNINANDVYGHLDAYDVASAAGETEIRLGKRLTDVARFNTVEKLFSGIFSIIMRTNLNGLGDIVATARPTDAPAYKFDVPASRFQDISWASYGSYRDSGSPMTAGVLYPLEEKLGNAYYQMTTIYSEGGELRAASAEALLRTMQDLWTVINEIRCADPIIEEEAVAKYLANEIFSQIERYFSYSSLSPDGGPVTGVSFKSSIVTTFGNDLAAGVLPAKYYNGVSEVAWPTTAELNAISTLSLDKFPFIFNLPRGATHMAFNVSRQLFYYPAAFNTSDMGGTPTSGNAYSAESYFYPAELMYFGNSPVRTSSVDKKVSDYPYTVGTWIDDASWSSDWNGTSVKASTRSVAMKYNINYGTAMLQTKVKYGAAKLYDNNKKVQAYRLGIDDLTDPRIAAESNKEINVDETSFRLTGIIIGGQSVNVGWDYLPTAGADDAFHYGFIYDKAIEDGTIPEYGKTSAPNNTLVFDNFKAQSISSAGIYTPASTQDVVYVALEFQNCTNQDFYGNYNLIRDGGYFYLIGALDPTKATNLASIYTNAHKVDGQDDGYVIPPYAADGSSQEVKRVFIQDFRTTVTFTLGPNSLQSAYLTVPDLRSGSMTLGLSVDLKWEEGLNFDVVLGAE